LYTVEREPKPFDVTRFVCFLLSCFVVSEQQNNYNADTTAWIISNDGS